MTQLNNGAVVTDIDAYSHNDAFTARGYTIRHVETWHGHDQTCIVWDAPSVSEADLPF